MKIGVLGAGKMGMAIVNGLLEKDVFKKEDIYICARSNKEEIKNQGFLVFDEVSLYQKSDILLLAIKPQGFDECLNNLKNYKGASMIISIAAGITIDIMREYLGDKEYVRVMPNTPSLIGLGASAICFSNVSDKKIYLDIFNSIGITKEIDEKLMDDIIPANGSLPAYLYYFANSFIKSSVARGIDFDVAKELVCETIIGSANMILKADKPIEKLINDVCSKGGATIEGIKVFDKYDLDMIVDEASISCVSRSVELGKKGPFKK